MSQQTIRQYISEIRSTLKINHADSGLTDRHIYLHLNKTRSLLIKQSKQWLMGFTEIFQPINNLELKEVDTVEACDINTNCKIKRSVIKLPNILEDFRGPIIKRGSSLDGYHELVYITPSSYLRKIKKKTSKYDKSIYFWVKNGFIYLPNVEWDSISLEAYLVEDYENSCNEKEIADNLCKDYQDNIFRLPESLGAPLTSIVIDKLLRSYVQIPKDEIINKNENIK